MPSSLVGISATSRKPNGPHLYATVRAWLSSVSWAKPSIGVLVCAPLSATARSKDRWLIQLRWCATAGMAATIAIARLVVPALPLLPLVSVLLVIAAVNVGWWAVLRAPRTPNMIAAQIALDSVLLTVLLALSGGLTNPFAVFIAFQPALAGILSNGRNGRTTLGIGILAAASIGLLAAAKPLCLTSAPIGAAAALLLGRIASLVSLVVFVAVSAVVYAERLADLREAGERNERLAILGRLVGSISHELATPLGTIVLGSRDLAAMLANGSQETVALARTVADQAERASDIIGLLRGHIRPDQSAERVDLSTLVPEIANRELQSPGLSRRAHLRCPWRCPRDGAPGWALPCSPEPSCERRARNRERGA